MAATVSSALPLMLVVLVTTSAELILSPPGEIRRNEGRDVFITCRYRSGGVERGQFTWYGPSVSPEEDNRVTITTTSLSSELTISGLRQKDNGTYHCTYASEHTHTTIIVHVDPSFGNVSRQQNLTLHSTSLIVCPVHLGYPEASIVWSKDGNSISNPRFNVTREGLEITAVEQQDAGSYSCSLERQGWGAISVVITVQVLPEAVGDPPQISPSDPTMHSINYTQTLELNCTLLAGTPPVRVWWSTPTGDVLSPHLRLAPTTYSPGRYSCFASNEYGSTSHTVQVNIRVPPMPSSKNWGTRIVQEGDTVMLPCELNQPANPEPRYNWSRLLEGRVATPIQQQAGRILITEDHQLQIILVAEEDEGLYQCHVRNDLGWSLQVIRLQVGLPTTPTVGTSSPGPVVQHPLTLATSDCSNQQVADLTQQLTAFLNQHCDCMVTISRASLLCTESPVGEYTATLTAPDSEDTQSLVDHLYRAVASGQVPGFCRDDSCVEEVENNHGLVAALVALGTIICVALVIALFICCCIKRSIRNRPKHGVEEGSPEPSPEDHPPFADDPNSEGYYHYPRTSARHCTCVVNNTSGASHLHPSSPQPVTQQA